MASFFFLPMPYDTFRVGDEHCNYKIDSDGNRVGEALGCFESEEDAMDQLTAVRIQENEENKSLYSSAPVNATLRVKELDDGRLWWVATYSNNIRDRDNPPEILSGESHRKAVYMTDKGIVSYPELWVWHEKAWHIGDVSWLAVDQTKDGYVFALAAGYVQEKAREFVLSLEGKDVALSHGMYPDSIERDPDDPSIITGYIDHEITILPRFAAANPLTGLVSSNQKEKDTMAVTNEKREALEKEWPGAGESLEEIEKMNARTKDVAKELALETKEEDDEEEESNDKADGAAAEKETREEGEVDTEKETTYTAADLRAEMVDAIKALNERFDVLETAIATSRESAEKQIAEIREELDDAARKEKQKKEAPLTATLASLVNSKSAVGQKETAVEKTDDLAAGPEESKDVRGKGLFFEEYIR